MIFRDHWQGEFSVALFGSIGLGLVSIFSPYPAFDDPRYKILEQISPVWLWQVTFISAGVMQLTGLFRQKRWLRLNGALIVFFCLLCVVQSILITAPWQLSLAAYAACIFTELCAIIFQTASIIRLRDFPAWWVRWMSKP